MFLIALVTVSCGAGGKTGEERTVVDLADDAQFARHQVETKAIDFGEEGSVKHLRDGWSHIEESAGNTRFRWAVGDSSGVRLNLSARRDLELTMTAKPHPLPQAAPQQVDVAFNGDSLATIEMQSRWSTYRLHVPATSQRLGENKLDFSYRYSRPLEESNGRADRRLAVAWERLAITDARVAVDEPATFGEPPRLFIPLGNRLEYFVALPEGSRLRISRVRARGGVNGEFVVDIAEDLREPLEIVISPDDSIDEPLLDGRSGVVRLALTAQPSALPEETQGFFLDEPLIVSPTSGATVTSPAERPSQRRPNVVVYLVDTLRTDALGVYDSRMTGSPAFDRFSAGATLFRNAVGQSSWTRASVASLFTGLWPARHGAIDRLDRLVDDADTLPELLRQLGYVNAAFVTNPNVTGKFGFAQGFDEFFHIRTHRASDQVNQRVFAWLTENRTSRPFFLYIHTMDPHHPYLPPQSLRPEFARTEGEMRTINRLLSAFPAPPELAAHAERLRALYDGAAAFNDSSFGELLEFLDSAALLEETIVVFLSDHGEEFFEHGDWQHGKNLHSETLNVPLAIRFPDVGHGREVRPLTGHVDLLPTLLDYLGVGIPADLDGKSVLPAISGSPPDLKELPLGRAYAHLSLDGHHSVAVVDGEWKLIVRQTSRGTPRISLFRWTRDSEERNDLSRERPVLTGYLESLIARKIASDPAIWATEKAELDAELERSLRALGYLR